MLFPLKGWSDTLPVSKAPRLMTASGMAMRTVAAAAKRSVVRWPRVLTRNGRAMQARPMSRAVVTSHPVPGMVHVQVATLVPAKNSLVTSRPMILAEDGQHGRPREPVAEQGYRPGQREVAPPSLPGVDGDAPRFVGEHGRRLRVHVGLERAEGGRGGPQADGPDGTQGRHREGDPGQVEAGIRQAGRKNTCHQRMVLGIWNGRCR